MTKKIETGRFSWHELLSRDPEGAEGFYGELLGWKFGTMAMGDAGDYRLVQLGEVPIGGITAPPSPVVPARGVGYVDVEDVDATAKKVTKLGGAALMDAFDVPGVGRIQPVRDPQGGVLMLFRSADEPQPGPTGHGAWHWAELWTSDPSAAAEFYAKAFGYERETRQMPGGTYVVLKSNGASRAGIMKAPAPQMPVHWAYYVAVDDVDATLARAAKLGGKLEGDAMDVPGVGRFGFVVDREGARLGLITPAR